MPQVTTQPQGAPKPLLFVYCHGRLISVPTMADANRVASEQAMMHAQVPDRDVHILKSVAVIRPPAIPLERVEFGDEPATT